MAFPFISFLKRFLLGVNELVGFPCLQSNVWKKIKAWEILVGYKIFKFLFNIRRMESVTPNSLQNK